MKDERNKEIGRKRGERELIQVQEQAVCVCVHVRDKERDQSARESCLRGEEGDRRKRR